MSRHSKRSVYIVNPVSDRHHTTRRSARRYVEQGRAKWVHPDVIEFIAEDRRHQAVVTLQPVAIRPHSPRLSVIVGSVECPHQTFVRYPAYPWFFRKKAA